MDYNAIWNEICFHIRRNRNAVEQDFQMIVELLFEKLGWSLFKNEIDSQMTVNVGSSRMVRPDIVIKLDGNIVLVVELKRANVNISERNADQLVSYMRLLKLNYGVLLGETLQLYCELSNSKNSPVKVCDIHFKDNSEIGVECIEVLSKNDFSFERLADFCRNCLIDHNKYCEKQSTRSEYRESSSTGFTGKSRIIESDGVNYSSKSSEYGNKLKGRRIYEIVSQPGNEYLYLGKQDIEMKLRRMSKDEIDYTSFHLNDKPSSKGSSWIRGDRFKQIYESK